MRTELKLLAYMGPDAPQSGGSLGGCASGNPLKAFTVVDTRPVEGLRYGESG